MTTSEKAVELETLFGRIAGRRGGRRQLQRQLAEVEAVLARARFLGGDEIAHFQMVEVILRTVLAR